MNGFINGIKDTQKLRDIALSTLVCLAISIPSWFVGKLAPTVGAPVFAIVSAMVIGTLWKGKTVLGKGMGFIGKYVLQIAVVFLGFGLDLAAVVRTGRQSLPIIVCTIATALGLAYLVCRVLKIPTRVATLIGVGSSICGGSAIAATAPVIEAEDDEVIQSISVIFLFNVIAALVFPMLGQFIGMSTHSGEAFGIFAGTAVNDTSSVTAAASTWDALHGLGSQTLDKAVTVKLTRTLAIIPITLVLAMLHARDKASAINHVSVSNSPRPKVSVPTFIIWFIAASICTTVAMMWGVPHQAFGLLKDISKFLIVLAMAAIGFNSDVVKLVKTGTKPLVLGAICWIGITLVSIVMQRLLGSW